MLFHQKKIIEVLALDIEEYLKGCQLALKPNTKDIGICYSLSEGSPEKIIDDAYRFLSSASPNKEEHSEKLTRLTRRSPLVDHINAIIAKRCLREKDIYKKAHISRQLFSKIMTVYDYHPSKDTVVLLAIGMELDFTQAQCLLNKAGYTLKSGSRRDMIIRYFFEHNIHDVSMMNRLLQYFKLQEMKKTQS